MMITVGKSKNKRSNLNIKLNDFLLNKLDNISIALILKTPNNPLSTYKSLLNITTRFRTKSAQFKFRPHWHSE